MIKANSLNAHNNAIIKQTSSENKDVCLQQVAICKTLKKICFGFYLFFRGSSSQELIGNLELRRSPGFDKKIIFFLDNSS